MRPDLVLRDGGRERHEQRQRARDRANHQGKTAALFVVATSADAGVPSESKRDGGREEHGRGEEKRCAFPAGCRVS